MRIWAKYAVLILVILSSLILPVIADEVQISDEDYSNEEVRFTPSKPYIGTGVGRFGFYRIQYFDDIELIQFYYSSGRFASHTAGTGRFNMSISGVTIGYGTWSFFETSPGGDWSIHLQFDYFNRGSNTGGKSATVTYTDGVGPVYTLMGTYASRVGDITSGSSNYACGLNNGYTDQFAPFYKLSVYFRSEGRAIAHSDKVGGIMELWTQRVISGTPYPSTVNYSTYPAGEVLLLNTGEADSTPVYFGTGLVLLNVSFPTGGHETILYNSDGTYDVGVDGLGETETISVNILEKYSNAAIVGQSVTVTPVLWEFGETKTSTYGETLHFNVVPGASYWFNSSRAGYEDYNQSYLIPNPPGIYNIYMERVLTPIANHSYAHFSVVDQTNGGLIPNAQIVLSDGQSKLTNSAGYTAFSVNNSLLYTYSVTHPNGYFNPASGSFNISADTSFLVALQRRAGPTPTWVLPSWTPVTVPTSGSGSGYDAIPTLSAQLRERNVQEGMDVWYTNLPFISQFLFLLFIIGGLGLMAGGTRRN